MKTACIFYFLGVWSWTNYLSILLLSSHLCKMEINMLIGVCKNNWDNVYKVLNLLPDT